MIFWRCDCGNMYDTHDKRMECVGRRHVSVADAGPCTKGQHPKGYGPCTRVVGHSGPCAHPFLTHGICDICGQPGRKATDPRVGVTIRCQSHALTVIEKKGGGSVMGGATVDRSRDPSVALTETGKTMFLVERGRDGKFLETVYATFDQSEAADFLKALPVGEDDYAVRRAPAWEMKIGDQVLTSVDAYRTMMNEKAGTAAAALYDVGGEG